MSKALKMESAFLLVFSEDEKQAGGGFWEV